ncbi:MAG: zinc ribbon domain-containing protein [Anaerolineales bacterium]|nr:zinc ribbon domain-containing protein [Anaerolineales bacterium]
MDIGSILLGLALVLVAAFIVAQPLVAGEAQRERQPGPADQLRAEHERVLLQLRDLDFDHATGKINEEDYAEQRALLVAQGVSVLKQLDALSAGLLAQAAAPALGRSADYEIEAAIAQRRAALNGAAMDDEVEAAGADSIQAGSQACHACGAAVSADDRFCPACGAAQSVTCPNCGQGAAAGDQFCGHCGQRLPAPAAGPREAQARG